MKEAGVSNVIEARDLKKSFPAKAGPVDAVAGLSIDVRRGEIFGFLGPNGAGKPNIGKWHFFQIPDVQSLAPSGHRDAS